jgi:hypothetical protein
MQLRRSLFLILALMAGACVIWDHPSDLQLRSVNASYNRTLERRQLVVEFTSSTNLVRYAKSLGVALGNVVFLCKDPEAHLLMSRGGVYYHEILVDALSSKEVETTLDKEKPVIYRIFIDVSTGPTISSMRRLPGPIDLTRDVDDVCFVVRGASTISVYRSNTVRIPRDDIVSALRRADWQGR